MNFFPLPLKFQNQGHIARPNFCGARNGTQGSVMLGKNSSNWATSPSLFSMIWSFHRSVDPVEQTPCLSIVPQCLNCASVCVWWLYSLKRVTLPLQSLPLWTLAPFHPPSNPRPLGPIHCHLLYLDKLYDHITALVLTLLWEVLLLLPVGASSQ